jgi:Holliday junction resolvase-like predicted endonuclease
MCLINYTQRYKQASWQNYRFDLVMVFDKEFDAYVEKTVE